MKKLLIALLPFYLLAFNACSNDDKPENPVDALPPITQTGENTFACLINGKPFFSSYKRSASYSGNSFGVRGSRRDDLGLRTVSIRGLDIEPISEGKYLLQSEGNGKISGIYLIGGGLTLDAVTTDEAPGLLTITRFDLEEFIVSGTFEFTVVDDDGNLYEITDGRFDLKF
ncbi:hypothetical protein GTQ34_01790 [Muricauda sp. JGD-17]|uniref:Uncharacterized protein n=1 Tax=Flagellimonas ochracea TaxID=2696472 RepID=A0A964WWB8_9FLAO|nr:hypothetical protein [Allomuricauda ochracea]NAY90638.1 hypothetical protein [Allomuricauda ochracea]